MILGPQSASGWRAQSGRSFRRLRQGLVQRLSADTVADPSPPSSGTTGPDILTARSGCRRGGPRSSRAAAPSCQHRRGRRRGAILPGAHDWRGRSSARWGCRRPVCRHRAHRRRCARCRPMKVMVTATQAMKMPWMRREGESCGGAAPGGAHGTGLVGVAGGGRAGGDSGGGGRHRGSFDPGSATTRYDVAALMALGRGEDVRTGGLLASPERIRRASVGPRSLRGPPGVQTPYGIQRQQHAMTCRFMACERAKDGEGAAARSLRAVRTTSGSAVALRPALVMGHPSGDAAEAQCQRRVRRNHMRTITASCQWRRRRSPFLGQGQDPSRTRTGPTATPATDPGIEG